MHDQANELRQLVRQSAAAEGQSRGVAPHLVAVTGGKGGVGTTTTAVNLAVALALQGKRVVLADVDFNGADANSLCQLQPTETVADLLSGRRTLHEVLQRGPAGMLVLPGPWSLGTVVDCTAAAQERLVNELRSLGAHADVVLLDVGSGLNRLVTRFCQLVDTTLVVTTADPVAVLDAYASIKVLFTSGESTDVRSLVNLAPDDETAANVHERLAQACRRFLGETLHAAGHVPADDQVAQAGLEGRSFLLTSPNCPASAAIAQLAEGLTRLPLARRSPGQVLRGILHRTRAAAAHAVDSGQQAAAAAS